jgi:hypothetical protein
MSAMSDRVREKVRRLPRVAAAPDEEPAAFERLTRDLRSDRLIWDAACALGDGNARHARASLLEALRLNPLRASRPWTFRLLLSSMVKSSVGR